MDKKFSRSPFTIILLGAAVIGLVTTIMLILTNPSRIPQDINRINPGVTQTQIFMPETPSSAGEQQAIARAKEGLVKKLSIPEQSVNVSSVESTTWPDSSLGCPRPGFFYAQVLTPGYKVVLEANGQNYDYHFDASKRFVLCKRADNQ